MPKALLIDSAKGEITEVTYDDYRDLRRLIGGFPLQIAWEFETGDVLFVDEEGLFRPQTHFLRVDDNSQPFAGNGIITGPDFYRSVNGEMTEGTDDVVISAADLAKRVRFLTRAQADSWAKANASEPAASITSIAPDGQATTTTLASYGALFGAMPRPSDSPTEDQ